MSKIRLVALFAVLMLVLSACAGAQNGAGEGTPGIDGALETPFGTEEGGLPVTGETPMATEPLDATEPLATEALATEPMATEPMATEALATESPSVDESPTVEGTPSDGVPVTGAAGLDDAYPNALSELNDYVIVDMNCEQVASIEGYLVSVGDGQLLYVVSDTTGALELDGRLLIPWDALDVNLDVAEMDGAGEMAQETPVVGDQTASPEGLATEAAGGEAGQAGACDVFDEGQAFMLNISTDQVAGAPVIVDDQDVNEFIGAEGWDDEIRAFWSDLGVEVNEAVDSAGDMAQGTPAAGDQAATEPAAGDMGQGTGTPGADTEMTPSEVGNVVFIESVGDLAVRNLNDEDIASVEDVILDPESGQMSHVLLSVGGFLGIGDRFVPVPWEALDFEMDGEQLVIVVDADQTRLEEAPGFESRDEFPSTQEEGWESEFDSYWETEG